MQLFIILFISLSAFYLPRKFSYLIATGTKINQLIKIKKDKTKIKFEKAISLLIWETIQDDWTELTYGKSADNEKIMKVLLLTNIELTRLNENSNEFFPFEVFKANIKSLEHIHAQNIIGIDKNKKEEWIGLLNAHISILPGLPVDQITVGKLTVEVAEIIPKITYEDFVSLSGQILKIIPSEDIKESEFLHKIENMALLDLSQNISLSNSVFEVKRKKILEMDKAGSYIPLATKRIFLKYYANDNSYPYSVWTKAGREDYLEEIKKCVNFYKPLADRHNEK